MKKSDLKQAFDAILPTEEQKNKMLINILSQSNITKADFGVTRKFKRIAAGFIIAVLAAGTVFAMNSFLNTPPKTTEGDLAKDSNLSPRDDGREDMVAPITDQFKIGEKNYLLLSGDYRKSANLPEQIADSDIGEKIATINSSADKTLDGCDVYYYKPAGCQAIVAVKQGNEYRLFKFLSFDSYNNNQDEDAAEYLELYGIKRASDISRIQFIVYDEQSKLSGVLNVKAELTDNLNIAKFYDFYSPLKNSSDKYFDRLFNFNDNAASGIQATDSIIDGGPDHQGFGGSIPGTPGRAANALADSVTIRIFNRTGIYFDTIYYPNIGFISRYEIPKEFAEFLALYIK